MPGPGSCACCNSWDGIERTIAAAKPWSGILGYLQTQPCDPHYLKRVSIEVYNWIEIDIDTGDQTQGSFTDVLTETWDRFTNIKHMSGKRTGDVPGGRPFDPNWYDQAGPISGGPDDNTHATWSQSRHNSDGCHAYDIVTRVTLLTEYPRGDFLLDWQALCRFVKFAHILAQKAANPNYLSTIFGYTYMGGIGHVDYFAGGGAAYDSCELTDADRWRDDISIVSLAGCFGFGDATAIKDSGSSDIYAWTRIGILPLTPQTSYCRSYRPLTTDCPHAFGAYQYTTIPSASATSIRMGDETHSTTFCEGISSGACS